MVFKCVVPGCKTSDGKNEKGGIPIFKFPDAYREPERRALWIAKVDCANWEPKKTDDIGP